ncbi:MAG: SMP-30/gluconolactonase/LRE family protein [Actinomycetota bacterium]
MSVIPRVEILARLGGRLLEGPAWDAARARLLLVDIDGMRRHAVDWATGDVTTHEANETETAWIPRSAGGTVVACRRGVRLADDDGVGPLALEVEVERRSNRSNDAKCDPAGRLWLGTMSDAGDDPVGSLYRVDADLSLTRVLEGMTISNGLGWSPDARRMYFVDSPTRRVDVFAYDVGVGDASDRSVFVETADFPGVPDGLAVDEEGCVWVAMHDGAALVRFSPDGLHVGTLDIPVPRPTSCCFAGPSLDRLVVTTAASDDGTGGDLFVCDVGVAGMPTIAFAG